MNTFQKQKLRKMKDVYFVQINACFVRQHFFFHGVFSLTKKKLTAKALILNFKESTQGNIKKKKSINFEKLQIFDKKKSNTHF